MILMKSLKIDEYEVMMATNTSFIKKNKGTAEASLEYLLLDDKDLCEPSNPLSPEAK